MSSPIYIYKVETMLTPSTILVFDPEVFSDGTMLAFMHENSEKGALLGTFQPSTNSLITNMEIIR